MRQQIEHRVTQALSRTLGKTLAESKDLDPRLDLTETSAGQMLRHGAEALVRHGREAAARLGHGHRVCAHTDGAETAGPLMLLGAIEADLHDDSDGAFFLAGNLCVGLASMSAASMVLHLAHHTVTPDTFFAQSAGSIRDLGRGTYQGQIASDFIADLLAAYKRHDHELTVRIAARWRPSRDRRVVTAICQVVTVCMASYVSLNEPYVTSQTTDPIEDVHHLIAALRADLMAVEGPGLGEVA